jgi:hypothetical protein
MGARKQLAYAWHVFASFEVYVFQRPCAGSFFKRFGTPALRALPVRRLTRAQMPLCMLV